MSNIPPAPNVMDVACSAPDNQDPIDVIQAAIDKHHDELAAIIIEKQAIIDRLENKQPTAELTANSANEENVAQDKLEVLRFISAYTQNMKGVQCFDPNQKKGNYTGVIIHLTDHHIVQKAGKISFVIHDRNAIKEAGFTVVKNDKLQIKYNAGRIVVNKENTAATAAINKILPPEQLEQLVNTINSNAPPNSEQEQEQERE